MRLLLDTHALLWAALNDPHLLPTAAALILDPANEKWVSPATYWELAIKISLKKLTLKTPFADFLHEAIDSNGFSYLHLETKHAIFVATLPFHHKDPFDRMLVAQAIVESIPIVSNDSALDAYGVKRLW